MNRRCISLALIGAVGLAAAGCTTPQSKLADGLYPLRGSNWNSAWGKVVSIALLSPNKIGKAYGDDQLTAENAPEALKDLDEAITLAKAELKKPDVRSAAYHDQTAYVIPLAHLGKAEIHARFKQITKAEEACWAAIKSSESFLGRHITRLNKASRPKKGPSTEWRYVRMRSFEASRTAPPRKQRRYTSSFNQRSARYIYYELYFKNLKKKRKHLHNVTVTYYRDGIRLGVARSRLMFKKGWRDAYHWAGWGAPSAGSWKPGHHLMVVRVDGKYVGQHRFTVASRLNRIPPLSARGRAARKKLQLQLAGPSRRRSGPVAFGSFFVFFRREKIRRQAFALLKEAYRRAGEKDLALLMDAQLENSDVYLTSKASHKEEEYVRTIENADWVAKDKATRTEVQSNIKQAANTLLLIGIIVAGTAASASAEAQAAQTKDPAAKARLRAQANLIRAGTAAAAYGTVKNMEQVERARRAQLAAIRRELRSTTAVTIARRVRLLKLSPQVRLLPAYRALKRKADHLDDYVKRKGFDAQAAEALADLRTSLDELTRQLQKKRTGS